MTSNSIKFNEWINLISLPAKYKDYKNIDIGEKFTGIPEDPKKKGKHVRIWGNV